MQLTQWKIMSVQLGIFSTLSREEMAALLQNLANACSPDDMPMAPGAGVVKQRTSCFCENPP